MAVASQYNPNIIDLILDHPDLQKELASLIGPNREISIMMYNRTFANKQK